MARTRTRDTGMNYWPGFVDALSTLILSIIFLLTVFMVAQFFLSQEVAGKDTALARLNAQISRLSDLLSLERTGKTTLEDEVERLRASLSAAEGERDRLRGVAEGAAKADTGKAEVGKLSSQLDIEKDATARAVAQIEILNQQIGALRRQIAALETALGASEQKDKDAQIHIADLGQRLNVALAQRVQELSRYRSDFFGKLREILGNRPDIRVVGDRFVFQSEVFFDSGAAVLRPEGRAELDKLASAVLELEKQNSLGDQLGAAGRRPHRYEAAVGDLTVQVELGPVGRPRDLGRAISDQQGRLAAAPGRRRLRRVPADRSRHHRGSLQPQPPDRAEIDREVRPLQSVTLRRYQPGDEAAAIALWLRTWQAAYPTLDFAERLDWWRARWRNELVPSAAIVIAETAGATESQEPEVIGFVTVDPRTRYLDQIVVAPEHWASSVGAALITEAKRLSPAGLDLDVNTDNARAVRFYEKHGFSIAGAGVNPISGKPVHNMRWRPQAA